MKEASVQFISRLLGAFYNNVRRYVAFLKKSQDMLAVMANSLLMRRVPGIVFNIYVFPTNTLIILQIKTEYDVYTRDE